MTTPLDSDPRWRNFQTEGRICTSCGNLHKGVFDLACFRPDYWAGAEEYEANSALRFESDFLSEDFCVVGGKYFFVRGVLELPIIGAAGATFGFGVWSSLSETNFRHYVAGFDAGHSGEEDWFGWFSNRLKGYPDTINLKCRVRPRRNRMRPRFVLEASEHLLALEQTNGITFERLLEIYAVNGHDVG